MAEIFLLHSVTRTSHRASDDVIVLSEDLCIIVNDDQQDATILAYLFIPNQLYMFWVMSSPIIRNTWLYLQLLILSTDIAAG